MVPFKVPAQALETAQEKLKGVLFLSRYEVWIGINGKCFNYLNLVFVKKPTKQEWKAFEIINADENMMQNFETVTQLKAKLLSVMETKARLPVS